MCDYKINIFIDEVLFQTLCKLFSAWHVARYISKPKRISSQYFCGTTVLI